MKKVQKEKVKFLTGLYAWFKAWAHANELGSSTLFGVIWILQPEKGMMLNGTLPQMFARLAFTFKFFLNFKFFEL